MHTPAMFDIWASVPFGQVNFDRMHKERRAKLIKAMEKRGVGGIVAVRDDCCKYISGSSQFHVLPRPLGMLATYMRTDGQVWLSTSVTDWAPSDIPTDHIFDVAFDYQLFTKRVREVFDPVIRKKGKVAVQRAGKDLYDVLAAPLEGVTVVDAEEIFQESMETKTQDELLLMKHALAITEAGMHDAALALHRGMREIELLGVYARRVGELGASGGETDGSFCITPRFKDPRLTHFQGAPYNRLTTVERALEDGDLVYLGAGARYWEYTGELGRTWYCHYQDRPPQAAADLYKQWDEVYQRMLEACRPGKTAADLRRACKGAGLLPDRYIAHGLGSTLQPPIVGTYLGEEFEQEYTLKPDMVLILEPYVWREGVGGFQAKQTVHITSGDPEVWNTFPMGPLAGQSRIIQAPITL